MNKNDERQARSRAKEQTQKHVHSVGEANPQKGQGTCPHCGAAIEADYEICPVCGHRLVDYCTFCGASMSPDDIDCPECGMPSDGVVCTQCGTLNFRSFCRKCSSPLSRAARKSVEKAKADPKVQEAVRLMKRLAELEAELDNSDDDEDSMAHEPTEKELRLRELMGKIGFTPVSVDKPPTLQAASKEPSRSREALKTEYQRMVEEANRVLEQMVPPAGSTPQEQRNYSTARKVAVMEIYKESVNVDYVVKVERMGWICNRCQVFHSCPEECAVKEYGGHWVTKTIDVWKTKTEEIEKQKKVYKKIDE